MRSLALLVLLTCVAGCSRSNGNWARGQAPATRIPPASGLTGAWDWNGVIGTGQSLSVGAEARELRATAASYDNLKLDLGSRFFPANEPDSRSLSLVPLREPIRPLADGYPSPYPRNIYGETPHTAMASQLSALVMGAASGARFVTIHSVVGESGQALEVIAKGAVRAPDRGHAYEASLFEARAITRLAKLEGRSYGVGAIVLTHGEADASSPTYAAGLRELLADYDADLRAVTGQKQAPLLLLTQQSSEPSRPGSLSRSALAAHSASEHGEIVCVAPKYQYRYVDDAVHLDGVSYDRLGEKYGQVYFERVVRGRPWRPLEPGRFVREAGFVSVDFHVPVAPLVWDDELPDPDAGFRPEWAAGKGFELSQGERPVRIVSVEIVDSSVRVHHAPGLVGPLTLRYAASAQLRPRPQGTRRWGRLRDSDPFVGALTRLPQPNHAVVFEVTLP